MVLTRAARLFVVSLTAGVVAPLMGLATSPAASASSPAAVQSARATTGSAWTELGPTSSAFEANGVITTHSSSGRVTKVRPDPSNPNQVYVSTAGGGVWKTPDITAATPTWTPLTDTQSSLATGAVAIDATHPSTLYAGLGETYDGLGGLGGPGAVIKSTDGGVTWSAPVALSADFGAGTVAAQAVRDLAVDPHNSQIVMAATDIGLFRSTDSGASYSNVSLPGATAPAQTYEFAYIGATGGTSTWLVSGTHKGTSPLDSGDVTLDGDIWRSTDAGATWTSLRGAGKLPTGASLGQDYARIALAAAPSEGDPTTARIYAVVASEIGGGDSTVAVFKSTDGGQTFTTIATGTTSVLNPPTSHGCSNMNVGHANSWYSLAIAVDPANSSNVLLGGDSCTYQTTDGGTSWKVASDWLPESGGSTANGVLPYVHEYVQDIALTDTANGVRAVVGSDGGIGLAVSSFGAVPEQVTWTAPNTGLGTLQFSSVAAGDSSDGDAGVVFGSTPNGTRFHAPGSPTGSFDQVVGGYAIGSSVGRTSTGATVYWGSNLGGIALYCQATADPSFCDGGGGHWSTAPSWANGTTDPVGNVYYSPIPGDATGRQLTSSTYDVFTVSSASPGSAAVNLSPSHFLVSATKTSIRYVDASQFPSGGHQYIGVALNGGHAAVGDYASGTATWTVGSAQAPLSLLSGTAFPRHATSLGGSVDGQTYLLSSAATLQADGTAVPASVGHLFLTKDAGASWAPFHGNGTSDLPNLPVYRVRFDPLDDTDSVIYAATAIGVYVTDDAGATWHRLGTGLPNAAVRDIWLSPDGKTMTVGTFGRGIWELALHQATTTTLTSNNPSPKDGQSLQLTATVAPSAAGGTVEFTEDGVSIGSATVSGGTATLDTEGLSAGLHQFLATYGGDQTRDQSVGSLNVVVPALQSVTVAPSPATAKVGHTVQLTAIGHYADSSTADITDTATWDSDTPSVATVSSTGLLSGHALGSALVTATATGSDGPHAGSTTVTVTGNPAVTVNSVPVATLAASVPVRFNGSEANGQITSYDVRYRVAGPTSTGWSAWSSPTKVTSKRVSMSIPIGKTRCAEVRSRDAVGATSAWSSPLCTARALDDPSLAASTGWQKVRGSAFYGGSLRMARRAGSTLTLKGTHIDRVGVVVTRCPGCGKLDVLLNGKVFKTVSLSATSTHNRVLVMLPRFAYKSATVVLRTRSASPVKIDGLVATRI